MLSKINKIKLAKLLQLVSETITDKGVLYSDTEFVIGVEVYVYDENNELIPASDGEYKGETLLYIVKDGKLAEIKEFTNVEDSETEPVEGEEKTETEMEEQEPTGEEEKEPEQEPTIEELKAIIADKEEQIADLQKEIENNKATHVEEIDAKDKRISELESIIAEYKEKEGKSTEEPIEQQEQKMSKQEARQNTVLEMLKNRKHN